MGFTFYILISVINITAYYQKKAIKILRERHLIDWGNAPENELQKQTGQNSTSKKSEFQTPYMLKQEKA